MLHVLVAAVLVALWPEVLAALLLSALLGFGNDVARPIFSWLIAPLVLSALVDWGVFVMLSYLVNGRLNYGQCAQCICKRICRGQVQKCVKVFSEACRAGSYSA